MQERANLAEQTLRQKEALLAEKERFQSEVQHFSQVRTACKSATCNVFCGEAAICESPFENSSWP